MRIKFERKGLELGFYFESYRKPLKVVDRWAGGMF